MFRTLFIKFTLVGKVPDFWTPFPRPFLKVSDFFQRYSGHLYVHLGQYYDNNADILPFYIEYCEIKNNKSIRKFIRISKLLST